MQENTEGRIILIIFQEVFASMMLKSMNILLVNSSCNTLWEVIKNENYHFLLNVKVESVYTPNFHHYEFKVRTLAVCENQCKC